MQVSDSDGSGSGSVLILDLVVHKERREGTYSMIKLRQRSLIKCGVYGGGGGGLGGQLRWAWAEAEKGRGSP